MSLYEALFLSAEQSYHSNNDFAHVAKQSRTNFLVSFALLPEPKRDAINTVYAFCRCTDDIVDSGDDHQIKHQRLAFWAEEVERGFRNQSSYPLLNKLNAIAKRFNIPTDHFFDLIHGMRMDLEKNRYETFDELYEYCFKVASSVGLMCSEIFGYKNEHTKEYAINLGIALQLTNIVRDVRSDAKRNRIYIPMEDFKRFGYDEGQLLAHVYNESFVEMMRFETVRARTYYTTARNQLAHEDYKAFFAARIMDRIYFRLLKKIEERNYDVFSSKVRVSSMTKLRLALSEYWGRSPLQYASIT